MTSNEALIAYIQAEMDGETLERRNTRGQWCIKNKEDAWNSSIQYRIKIEPREWYVNEYTKQKGHLGLGYLHDTKESANTHSDIGVIRTIKVREVFEDDY